LVSSGFVLKETMAEHRAYLPGLGLAALISWRAPWRLWAWIVPAIFASLTVARNLEWQDETKLWRGAALRWSDSADVWYGYGDTLRFAARWAEAEAAYSTAATLDPARPDPWVNLGVVRAERGDEAGATRAWEQALVALPGHCAALNNLAALALKRGAASEAIDGFEGSLVSCPDDATAHYQLGILYAQSGDQRRAIFHLRAFLAVDGNSPGAASARTLLQRLGESP
jgi:tetratricopeptide (TPR) repeat protein